MRAAAIFGPGASTKDLKPFQQNSKSTWLLDLPTDSNQADAILIFGGDGTIHRYLAQLVTLQLPVLVVPCGSGNDFAKALNLPTVPDSLAAWRKFCSGVRNARAIDLGVITPLTDREGTERFFCGVGGVGLDAEIARRANRLPRWLRARGGYAVSLLPALLGFAPITTNISGPSAGKPTSIMIATFANAQSYGGGMKVAPHAQLDDGLLDICVIRQMNKFRLFCLFPTVYFGRHLSIPEVEYFQAEHLKLETDEPQDVYADGEYVCRTPVEVSVARRMLQVIVP